MEIVGDDGSRIDVKFDGSKAVFGRGLEFNTKDRTVSRSHVLFQISCKTENQAESRVSFEVIGKNPVWVVRNGEDEENIEVFRKLEKGEVGAGDWFCISSRCPVWFNVKKIAVAKEEKDLVNENFETSDFSMIDPVKEFGFLVIGHEFDCYPKHRIRDAKNWDWFLEGSKQESSDDDDDESFGNGKKKRGGSGKRKRKKRGGNDDDEDEDWSGESEEDKETLAKTRNVEKLMLSTRSKNKLKTISNDKGRKKKSMSTTGYDEEEDEDETIGGFIVNDDDEELAEEEEEEEEEFVDDDEELDD